jgi:hypothetical protein
VTGFCPPHGLGRRSQAAVKSPWNFDVAETSPAVTGEILLEYCITHFLRWALLFYPVQSSFIAKYVQAALHSSASLSFHIPGENLNSMDVYPSAECGPGLPPSLLPDYIHVAVSDAALHDTTNLNLDYRLTDSSISPPVSCKHPPFPLLLLHQSMLTAGGSSL